jgi:DNA-binding Lrp family transcriptional regulator
LGAIAVDVIGISDPPISEQTVNEIGANEFVLDVFLAAGGYVMVRGLLRSHSDLEPFLQSMKVEGHLSDIWVGLQSFGLAGRNRVEETADSGEMTSLDFRILNCLRSDSRKPVNEIAEEVGVSTKTVARRLNRMIEERRITLSVKWYPGLASGVVTYLQIELNEDADKSETAINISERYSPRIAFLGSYSNHPRLLGAISWTPTPFAQNALTTDLSRERTVKAVMSHVLLKKHEFPSWIDALVASKAATGKA